MDENERVVTDSGIELKPLYGPEDLEGFDPERDLGRPGEPPFTRGIYASMYRQRLWTMRQYAGMATAEETNRRFRYLLEHGQTGLSVAFDLPTQMGLDSDHPRADRARQQLERDPHHAADGGEVASLGLGLHLEQHRLVVALEERAHVALHLRIHDVHAGDASR